ncbi:MAG TPA: aromatic amino acid ammonia-lyase [Myxococcota bacterium]|nr:aromatic amino acid ammonia-lyase [Myxococcota bacterium]HRY92816.1 aromatic amino acid ammonia-lyase [Myxococcota bacterium]HSA19808.1 aromatic amino acid ammonia-lyase [Myxococcota bacterium]
MVLPKPTPPPALTVGDGPVSVRQIDDVARRGARVELSAAPAFRARLERSRATLQAAIARGEPVYGVTTGYGQSCGNQLDAERTEALGQNLVRYHGAGLGEPLGVEEARAVVLCRLLSLARGFSGVSGELLDALVALLNHGITPVIPCQGSVGASGDLTPLSYLAACLQGEREAFHRGRRVPAAEALAAEGLAPYRLQPKEPLALVNGTSVMTGLAVLAVRQAEALLQAFTAGTALAVHALAGHARHFHPGLFAAKPHPGQAEVAARLRALLEARGPVEESNRPESLQDPYSCRCSPHVLGVLADALAWVHAWIEVEANGVSDNPLLDPDSGEVLTGGNFYGGHVAFAMDALKAALASAADLADRQLALLVDARFSRGLPANLVPREVGPAHHGLKAVQITASALTAEALRGTMPAASFSRSTESHNQDKVSMGTIAARDALGVARLAAGVAACQLLGACQAAELRGGLAARPRLAEALAAVRLRSPALTADRPLDAELARLAADILAGDVRTGVEAG